MGVRVDMVSDVVAVLVVFDIARRLVATDKNSGRVSIAVAVGVGIPSDGIDGCVFIDERIAIVVHAIAYFVGIWVVACTA